jgi:hypothetical protein
MVCRPRNGPGRHTPDLRAPVNRPRLEGPFPGRRQDRQEIAPVVADLVALSVCGAGADTSMPGCRSLRRAGPAASGRPNPEPAGGRGSRPDGPAAQHPPELTGPLLHPASVGVPCPRLPARALPGELNAPMPSRRQMVLGAPPRPMRPTVCRPRRKSWGFRAWKSWELDINSGKCMSNLEAAGFSGPSPGRAGISCASRPGGRRRSTLRPLPTVLSPRLTACHRARQAQRPATGRP